MPVRKNEASRISQVHGSPTRRPNKRTTYPKHIEKEQQVSKTRNMQLRKSKWCSKGGMTTITSSSTHRVPGRRTERERKRGGGGDWGEGRADQQAVWLPYSAPPHTANFGKKLRAVCGVLQTAPCYCCCCSTQGRSSPQWADTQEGQVET